MTSSHSYRLLAMIHVRFARSEHGRHLIPLTGDDFNIDVLKAKSFGAFECLVKPANRQALVAALQEEFDCEVLDIDWNEFVAGTKMDPEESYEDGCRTLNEFDEKRLRDWYPIVVAETPLEIARVICQRENLVYDSDLRVAYRRILFWFVVVFVVLFSAASLAFNPSFISLVLALVPATPALTWALRENKRQSDTLETLTRLRAESEKLLKATINGVDAAEARRRSRELQDAIFGHRLSSSLVFDWLYDLLRPRLEAKLVHGAQRWVEEANRVSK